MANVIRFEIETNASYTEAEKVDLLDSFLQFISEADGDVIEDTETIVVTNKADLLNKKNIDAEVVEWLDEAEFTVKLNVANGELAFETTLK